MRGRQLLEHAFRKHGISDVVRIESHIRGCDLSFPVVEQLFPVGETFAVWVRDGGVPGKYGAPVDQDPGSIGITIVGRHREVYRVLEPLLVVRCTAATFPSGVVDGVGGSGGGTQYVLPPSWLKSVERIA